MKQLFEVLKAKNFSTTIVNALTFKKKKKTKILTNLVLKLKHYFVFVGR